MICKVCNKSGRMRSDSRGVVMERICPKCHSERQKRYFERVKQQNPEQYQRTMEYRKEYLRNYKRKQAA